MKTRIITDQPIETIMAGAKKMYDAVSTTMGPRGRNVIFRKQGGRVGVTHDGVTVAKMVKLDDEAENASADLLREAAAKLDTQTGDGTTTVTVLTYNILKAAAEKIRQGENPMRIKLQLDKKLPEILEAINQHVMKEPTEKQLIQVATVAAGDDEVGSVVGKAIFAAGKDTPIMLGFSDVEDTFIETINGFKINAGPASPYLMSTTREDLISPKIIVCDAKLRDKEDILPVLQVISTMPPEARSLLVIAPEVSGDALSLLVMNKLKNFANIAVCRVPQSINVMSEYLADIAISTGATVMAKNGTAPLNAPSSDYFGSAVRVTVESGETVIVDGKADRDKLMAHKKNLKKLAKEGKTDPIRKFASDRLMTLEQKVISIRVGGQSDTDAEERHYRYEDAVGASRAALRNGTVPGGGTMFYEIAAFLDDDILSPALESPMQMVLGNAGIEIKGMIEAGFGFDVLHPEDGIIDLKERGIIDPAESEIECIKTAVAIAGLLITSGAMVIEEEDAQPQPS